MKVEVTYYYYVQNSSGKERLRNVATEYLDQYDIEEILRSREQSEHEDLRVEVSVD